SLGGGNAFRNAHRMHDGRLHPALDLSEIVPGIVRGGHGCSNAAGTWEWCVIPKTYRTHRTDRTSRPCTPHPFFGGASPNFLPALVINSSNRLRALGQVLSLSGTSQPPLPLHSFSPGCSPQPPCPLQSFMPLQSCAATVAQWAWPAHSLVVPFLPLFLHVLM